MARWTKRTTEKDARLLGMLRAGYTMTQACKRAGYSYQSFKRWRREDAEFDQAVDDAYDEGTDAQAGALERRGWEGWEEPVFYKGRKVGSVRKFSDTASIFSLKQRNPKRYNERLQVEHSGGGGGPIQITKKVFTVGPDGAVARTRHPVTTDPGGDNAHDAAGTPGQLRSSDTRESGGTEPGGGVRVVKKVF